MGTDHPNVQSAVDLIHQLAEALRASPLRESDQTADAIAAYNRWLDASPGQPGATLASMHDVLAEGWTQELTIGEPPRWTPSNRDRALGHAVELGIVGIIEQANVVKEATTFLAFLEGDDDVAPPVPVTAATLSDRLDELTGLGLYVWGSDCMGECSGNTTPDSLVCDQCGGTRTTPLLGLIEDR